jgi:transposase InsO family protein
MTDNGSCYKSRAFAKVCRDLGLRHIRTKPYTPKTTIEAVDRLDGISGGKGSYWADHGYAWYAGI